MENGLKTENESTEDKNNKKLSSCCTIRPSEAVILTAAMICMVILYGPDKAYGLLYIEFLSLYEEGPGITSLIYSVFSLSAAVIGPLAGFLTDNIRNGPFLAIFVGTIIGGLGYVWTCYANSVIEVIMAQGFLIGCGQGLVFTGMITFVNKSLSSRPILSNGVVYSGGSIGGMVWPSVIRLLINEYTVRGTMLIVAAIWLNLTVSGLLCWSNKPKQTKEEASKEADLERDKESSKISNTAHKSMTDIEVSKSSNTELKRVSDGTENQAFDISPEKEIEMSEKDNDDNTENRSCHSMTQYKPFMGKLFVTLFIYIFFVTAALQGLLQYLPAYCEEKGIDSTEQASVLTVISTFDLISRVVISSIGDRIIYHKYKILLCSYTCVGTLGLALPFYFTTWTLYGYSVVFGMTSDMVILFAGHLMVESVGLENIGKGWGFVLTAYAGAGIVISLSLGYIREMTNTYFYTLPVTGVLQLLGIFTLYVIGGRYKTHQSKTFTIEMNIQNT